MCLPFLCGGRDDHGPSPRHHRSPPPQHPHAFSDHSAVPHRKQAAPGNAGGRRMDNGPAHPAPGWMNNSGAAEKTGPLSPEAHQGYVPAGAPRHEPLAAPRPVEDWTRQGPARLFTRRAGDDDAPTAASNDQVSRGGNRGGAGEREYRSKSRGPVIR
ncbi:hypothetical protein VPH35_128652 [Triticum aestivum]